TTACTRRSTCRPGWRWRPACSPSSRCAHIRSTLGLDFSAQLSDAGKGRRTATPRRHARDRERLTMVCYARPGRRLAAIVFVAWLVFATPVSHFFNTATLMTAVTVAAAGAAVTAALVVAIFMSTRRRRAAAAGPAGAPGRPAAGRLAGVSDHPGVGDTDGQRRLDRRPFGRDQREHGRVP